MSENPRWKPVPYNRSLTESVIKSAMGGFLDGLEGGIQGAIRTDHGALRPGRVRQDAQGRTRRIGRRTASDVPNRQRAKKAVVKDRSKITKDQVREAQELLTELGYNPGPIDGLWGPSTSKAYQYFLRVSGLRVTGVLTMQTLQSLRDAVSSVNSDASRTEAELSNLDKTILMIEDDTYSVVEK